MFPVRLSLCSNGPNRIKIRFSSAQRKVLAPNDFASLEEVEAARRRHHRPGVALRTQTWTAQLSGRAINVCPRRMRQRITGVEIHRRSYESEHRVKA